MGLDLVSGGSGFIGSHICAELLARGRKVRVLDNLATGRASNLDGLDVEWVRADASDPDAASQACQGVDTIFHLAARPSVPWSFEYPEAALLANHGTTQTLIEAGSAAGVRRIVFSSSSAIYGDDPVMPKTEGLPPAPQSPYAEHKLAGEVALRQAAQAGKLSAVCLRYFNVYGPRQDPSSPYSGVISLFSKWAREGDTPKIFGDGLQTRDFIFVGDVVQANLLSAHAELAEAAPIFNVATGTSVNLLDLWQAVCAAAGIEAVEPEFLPARTGDVRDSLASIDRARAELGFEPQVTFAEGIRRTLAETV